MPISLEDQNVKLYSQSELDQAVAQEREACAKLIEALPPGFGDKNRNDVAAMIRNRTDS